MNDNLKVLVTGGLGNLGSWITDFFIQKGHTVYVMAKNQRVTTIPTERYFLISGDITSEEDCSQAVNIAQPDVIIHAASVNDGFVKNYSRMALEVNGWGTRCVLEATKNYGKVKNFIYLSTFQVYGKYAGHIDEETLTLPKNDYGLSHLFAEQYVRLYAANFNMPYSIIRLTNSYGCPKDADSSKWYLVLNDLSRSAFEKEEIVLKSNGKAPRDFIHMGDVCEVLEKLAGMEAANDTFNLAGEQTLNMLQVAEAVKEAYFETYGKKIPVLTNLEDKSEYPEGLHVSAKKLKKRIPFQSKILFKEEAVKIFAFLESVKKNKTA